MVNVRRMNSEQTQQVFPQIDRYAIRAELGRGGMGIVYRAYEPALEREIALKVLSPDLAHQPGVVARVRREAISAARLRHPNIALLYEYGHADEMPFLAMEYVPGISLRQLLEAGQLAPERALSIVRQIGDALDYAHAHGIVHRDVKPSNILVGPDDHAVLIDFGLAEVAERSLLTTDGAVLGTPHYMAPEQADGRGAEARSDQYGLAAVAYEMLTGMPPFHGRSTTAIIYAHIHDLPPPPNERQPTLPAAVNQVLLRALAKDPRARYPALAGFVADLTAALAAPVAPPQRSFGQRWRLAAIGGLALALVAALALLLNLRSADTIPPPRASGAARSGVPLPQTVVWSYSSRPVGGTAPLIQRDIVVADTLAGSLVALRADTGAVLWQTSRVNGRETIFGAPGVGSGLVFAGSADEEVFGFSLDSGGLIWRRPVQGVVQAAPVLSNDRLVVTTAKGYLYVLQAGSGQVIWSRPLHTGLRSATVSADQIFVSAGPLLMVLDLNSGVVVWEFQAASTLTTRPVVFDDLMLVGSDRGVLYALQLTDGQERWHAQINGALSAAPSVGANAIFVVDRAGGLTALRADGASVLWHFDAGVALNATPLLADGKLLFGASNGIFYALDASDGRELAHIQLNGSIDTTPALGDGLIYVRADRMYALGESS